MTDRENLIWENVFTTALNNERDVTIAHINSKTGHNGLQPSADRAADLADQAIKRFRKTESIS